MDSTEGSPVLRIGELSRRLGVSAHLLRAWESRYGLLRPVRTPGGFRLYYEADERRVRRMQAHLARGLSAAQAARAALEEDNGEANGDINGDASGRAQNRAAGPAPASPAPASPVAAVPASLGAASLGAAYENLRRALDAFDETSAQAVLDRLVADFSLFTALREVILPYLAELGTRWEQGTASIAQEHFASNVIHGRLAGLARGWGNGHGPLAVLACPPGELHDLPLMIFGIALNRTGWRVSYLGTSTPLEEVTRTVEASDPDLVVLAAARPGTLDPFAAQLIALARRAPLMLAGAGVTPQLAASVQATLLTSDPVTAAENVGWPRSGHHPANSSPGIYRSPA
ncbi:MAG: cobalamin B12-binding domain-containing protein [Streptosporangiaceae bacterium]|jgi:DNA-binding transcriptional MerR regulator